MDKTTFIKIIESIDKPKESIAKLVELLSKTDFFIAPASVMGHNAFECGLMQHSYNVYVQLKKKNEEFDLGLTDSEVIVIGLLHDVCKIGRYKPNVLKSGKLSEAKPYVYEDAYPLHHGAKSVIMLQNLIPLTSAECICIHWHMGAYDDLYRMIQQSIMHSGFYKQIVATHLADMEASQIMEFKENEK
jgi:hypothetical protein